MKTITFNDTALTIVEDSTHEFLMSNKEVALGYGTSIQSLSHAKNNELQKLEYENKDLKRILVGIHNRYHEILTTCSPLAIQDELRKMTNLFQFIRNGEGENNLNTKTVSRHGYWR